MTPREYGAHLAAADIRPLTPEQIEAAARILASIDPEPEQHPQVA